MHDAIFANIKLFDVKNIKINKDLNEISFSYTIKLYNKNEVERIERNVSTIFSYSI